MTRRRRCGGRAGCSISRSSRRSGRENSRFRRAGSWREFDLFHRPGKRVGESLDIEFEPTGETAPDAGLTVIDHLAQSMHYEEMLTWLLFYSSLLELDKVPAQDVLDPGGLVKSQVVQSPDGAVRIILMRRNPPARSLRASCRNCFGSGVQHIAFQTEDIFATVAKLRANGVPLLRIPENYYDDLEARTGLGGDELDRLKSLDILYRSRRYPRNIFQSTRTLSRIGFLLKSCSGAITRASARPTRRSGSRRRPVSRNSLIETDPLP